MEALLWRLAEAFKSTNIESVEKRVEMLLAENTELKQANGQLSSKLLAFEADELVLNTVDYNGVPTLVVEKPSMDVNSIKNLVTTLKNKAKSVVVFVISKDEDKVTFVSGVTADWNSKGIAAGNLIKEVCSLCEGRGGGKPDMAQGGAKDLDTVKNAVEKVLSNLNK